MSQFRSQFDFSKKICPSQIIKFEMMLFDSYCSNNCVPALDNCYFYVIKWCMKGKRNKINTLKVGNNNNCNGIQQWYQYHSLIFMKSWTDTVFWVIIIITYGPIFLHDLSPGVLTVSNLTWSDNNLQILQKDFKLFWNCVKKMHNF